MTALQNFSSEQIQLPSGLTLEVGLSIPLETSSPGSNDGKKLAVCLHPWSWLGGRMTDPVLNLLKRPLLEKGYHVLRYNSRGVGKSSGWSSLTGQTEGQDLQELVRWALGAVQDVQHLLILGYSHGSLIASLLPILPDLSQRVRISHILLSYPLGPRSWLTAFRGGPYTSSLNELIHNPKSNILVIYGDQDEFTGVSSYETWVEALKEEAAGEGTGKLRVECVEGGTHFWRDDDGEYMVHAIKKWLS